MRRLTALLIASIVVLTACSGSEPAATTTTTAAPVNKIRVVATTPVVADFARVLGADLVEVHSMVSPNVDAHDYEPSPADITAIAQAQVIVKNGAGFEDWLDKTLEGAETRAVLVDASEGVQLRRNAAGVPDPHIWHNPLNAKAMVANISRGLQRVDAERSGLYQNTERGYLAQLDALDSDISRSIGRLANKKLVTNHDSFGYYVVHYGLEYVGSVVPSFDTQAEVSAGQIAQLVERIKQAKVPAIFSDSPVPPAVAQTISTEAGVKVIQGRDALYGDSLGGPNTSAATYLDMMRHNTAVISRNLA